MALKFNGAEEYPVGASGTRIEPEIVAWSRVPYGNTTRPTGPNGEKTPTHAHTFGAVTAYDGHRVGNGRVVCDSTWHHFINVNLIGVVEGKGFDEFSNADEDQSKHSGFLSSVQGGKVLDQIKNYYTNIGVWISPPASHECFNSLVWWEVLFSDRILEATLTRADVALEKVPASALMQIGIQARDVFGHRASQCQSLEWIFDMMRKFIEIAPLDPWDPIAKQQLAREDMPLPVFDPMPLVDVALGAALLSLRKAVPMPPQRLTKKHDEIALKAIQQGVDYGLRLAARLATTQYGAFTKMLKR